MDAEVHLYSEVKRMLEVQFLHVECILLIMQLERLFACRIALVFVFRSSLRLLEEHLQTVNNIMETLSS
jgi:hypothetical protein